MTVISTYTIVYYSLLSSVCVRWVMVGIVWQNSRSGVVNNATTKVELMVVQRGCSVYYANMKS